MAIHTTYDRTIIMNKPLVDVTIPDDEGLVETEIEKRRKYLDHAHEISTCEM